MRIFVGQKGKQCDDATYSAYTHKVCTTCLVTKSVSLFYRKITRTKRGWAWDSRCIDCRRRECKRYGATNKESRNARLRAWRRKNPAAATKNDRNRRLRRQYGITVAEVEKMRKRQNGRCAICQKKTNRLFVDHCHTKGHVRALLCQTCNTFLGWYEKKADTILKFQQYISTHAKEANR